MDETPVCGNCSGQGCSVAQNKPTPAQQTQEAVQTLIAHDVVDEFWLMIDPIVLGGGKRFFRDDGGLRALRLPATEKTTTSAILATYARAAG